MLFGASTGQPAVGYRDRFLYQIRQNPYSEDTVWGINMMSNV